MPGETGENMLKVKSKLKKKKKKNIWKSVKSSKENEMYFRRIFFRKILFCVFHVWKWAENNSFSLFVFVC